MQAIELETEIDDNHEIHLKLPDDIKAGKARVVVLYKQGDDQTEISQHQEPKPLKLGLFAGKLSMRDDFDDPLPDEFWLSGNP